MRFEGWSPGPKLTYGPAAIINPWSVLRHIYIRKLYNGGVERRTECCILGENGFEISHVEKLNMISFLY